MYLSKQKIVHLILILLLIAEIDFSFRQHEHKTLDGDMALIAAPSESYKTILHEPFGGKAFIKNEKYAGSNRYFVHRAMHIYYKQLYPFFSSFFIDKTDFLYKYTGFFQLIIQLFLIILLLYYATNKLVVSTTEILFMLILISALFQTHGFSSSIGVIDHSVTYTFFYAMPMSFLLFFFTPYLRWNIESKNAAFKFIFGIFWILFAYMLSMSGPIIPPLGIMIAGSIALYLIIKCIINFRNKKTVDTKPTPYFSIITLSVFLLCCMYSFYIGLFNAESSTSTTLSFRYEKLIEGLKSYFIQDISFLLIAVWLAINFILLKKNKIQLPLYVYVMVILVIIYIFLLPLGGYRSYRPTIIRNDTFLPVTLLLFYCIARSTLLILSKSSYNKLYLLFLFLMIGIFTIADKPEFDEDRCQRAQIKRLQHSNEVITTLPSDCPILTWDATKDTTWTRCGSEMLYYWEITDSIRIYKHE